MTDPDQLVARTHPQPHSYLGAHPDGKGVVVRVFRPDARQVTVVPERGEPVAAEAVHPGGVFEASLPKATLPLRYRVDVEYAEGRRFTLEDPYRFLPTLGELDLHLLGEGRHEALWERLGAHVREVEGVTGVAFAVWAPSARSVSVVGDFNSWDGRLHPMRSMGSSGIWELFVPDVQEGTRYKYEILTQGGEIRLKADPMAFATEVPPLTASVVHQPRHEWRDEEWLRRRRAQEPLRKPISIYEVHLTSWRRDPADPTGVLSYKQLADELAAYVKDLGFTHIELLPVMAHPFSGSWGYQVTGYYAPMPAPGTPDDFREFVDRMHEHGIGIILDWVPAHFPRDDFALARFDGTALYEHADPRRGSHPDWGTLVFNFGRTEVRNFLIANALFWLREYHIDGIRVDAVASMLYLDYSRKAGEWIPNQFGGREDLEAVQFLREMNEVIYGREPGVISAAEESTAWPGVSRPTYVGGLGFGFKWNMGWMHDTLEYFSQDPVYRRWHHNEITFSLMYAFSENFILPLSHDEVVHGKGSLLDKMPGDHWQKRANLRALYAYMWAHPGKKLLFMGQEFGQWQEWSEKSSLDWHLLEWADHQGIQSLVRDLNHHYQRERALWDLDHDPSGFYWIEGGAAEDNVLIFARRTEDDEGVLVFVANLAPVVRERYRVGLPRPGTWLELVNTDAENYGGSGQGNMGAVESEPVGWNGQPFSAEMTLPPLGAIWLVPEPAPRSTVSPELEEPTDPTASELPPAPTVSADLGRAERTSGPGFVEPEADADAPEAPAPPSPPSPRGEEELEEPTDPTA